ncbi:hypothetical protein MtrunA17_Chr3g0097131 [Medicago truncatula]|uniref:Uncharacterized protein n=1 Tax=Medicago truncatula TaxID=3880 RepID=A0A396IVF1_MEDTR|nr:hypothetical protein MtrunA17_Chr3g0097131 [Medicago truncatula]
MVSNLLVRIKYYVHIIIRNATIYQNQAKVKYRYFVTSLVPAVWLVKSGLSRIFEISMAFS